MAKILIADDDPALLGLFPYIFEEDEVILVSSSDETVSRSVEDPPDLIIVDVRMPGNGFEAVKRLRKDNRTMNIPIIIMSSFRGAAQAKATGLGIPFLQKPFAVDEIRRLARKLILNG